MIVLASSSPRRHQLLDMLGIAHEIDPSSADERQLPGEGAEAMASRLAREKALFKTLDAAEMAPSAVFATMGK